MEEDTVVALPRPGSGVMDDPLLAVLREGARRMLTQAIKSEVEAFLAAHAVLVDAAPGALGQGPGPAVLALAITGLGGVGKTQTALAYCYQHLADYRLIWWLRAEEPATLAADYAALARPFGPA